MEVPKLYRISAEVERDQRERFRAFSKTQGRTMRAQLTHMVGEAIVGVELPKVVPKVVPKPAYVPPPAPKEEDDYFEPNDEFWLTVERGAAVPYAITKVRDLCQKQKLPHWDPPPFDEDQVTEYRARAVAAGRDPDVEMKGILVWK